MTRDEFTWKDRIKFWTEITAMGIVVAFIGCIGLANGVSYHPEWADQFPGEARQVFIYCVGGMWVIGIIIEISSYIKSKRK